MLKMIIFFILVSINTLLAQSRCSLQIDGTIVSPAGKGTVLFKRQLLPNQLFEPIDSISAVNSSNFKLSYQSLESGYYLLTFQDNRASTSVPVLVDEGDYSLTVVIDTLSAPVTGGRVLMRKIKLTGSEDNELMDRYFDIRKHYYSKLIFPTEAKMRVLSKADSKQSELDSLNAILRIYRAEMTNKLNQFVISDMGTSIAVYQTMTVWDNDDLNFMSTVMEKFRSQRSSSFILPIMEERYRHLVATRMFNKAPPTFALPDASKKEIKLMDYIGKKMILLDFWASWCGPCIKEMKSYQEVHEKILAKNILIISVSIDKHEEKWKKALETYKFPWIQIIDVTGATAKQYGVNELPSNFMIDINGVVTGKNLSLSEILK